MSARRDRCWGGAACAVAALLAGCASRAPPRAPTGRLQVTVAPVTAPASIDAVVVDVEPAGVHAALVAAGAGTFTGAVEVAAGAQTVRATASAGGVPVGTGSAEVVVVENARVAVAIWILDTTGPDAVPDHAPVILSVTAPTTVVAGAAAGVSATGLDPDGDPIAWSWSASCPGAFADAGAASTRFTPASAGTCALTVTASARGLSDARSVTVDALAPFALEWWTEGTVGDFGYFDATPPVGLWDEAPGGQPDHLMLFQGGTPILAGSNYGSNHVVAIHGPIGGPLAVDSIEVGPGVMYTTVAWDTVGWRIHALAWANQSRDALYLRLAPVRDASGRITGFTKEAEIVVDAAPLGVYALGIAEVVDGAGAHRLALVASADTFVQPLGAVVAWVSTRAAGVTPASRADFTSLDGSAPFTELKRFQWDSQPSSMAAYGTSATVVSQRGSGRLQFLAATGLHGQPGPHFRVEARPSGTGWTVPDPATILSYNDTGANGSFAVPGPDDSVWWIWEDGAETRISRVNADGTVDWTPLPPLDWFVPYPGETHLSLQGGRVLVILHASESSYPSPTRARLYADGAWHPWQTLVEDSPIYTHGGFAGLGVREGRFWTAAATSGKQSGPPRIIAVAYPP